MNKKTFIFSILILGLIFMPILKIEAQTEKNIIEENIEVEKPGLLPTSPFYFFKNAFQGIRSTFTFDPVKKAQLNMRYANQRALEAKALAKEKKNSELVSKTIQRYQKKIKNVSQITNRSKKEIKDKDKQFVEKTLDQILKQNRLLDNVEKNIAKEVKEKIREARDKANQSSAQILSDTSDAKSFKEQIQKSINNQTRSKFKEFKDISILKQIQNHSPEDIKDIIEESTNYTLSNFKEKLENMSSEEREKFNEYIDQNGGNDVTHFQLLQKLEKESSDDLREQIGKAKKKAMQNIEYRIQNKEKVLESLQNGDMDNLSTIQEMEENVAPGLVEKIMNTKHQALNNFRIKMEKADNREERNKLIKKAKENANINKLQILNEIEENVSEEDKTFIKQIIQDVNKEIKNKINSAPINKDNILKDIAGSSPEAIETAQKMISDPILKEKILQAQIVKLKKNIQTIRNPEKIESIKEKIRENKEIRNIIKEKASDINYELEKKSQQYMNQIHEQKARQQLDRTRKQLSDLQKHFQNLKNQFPNFEAVIQDKSILNLSKKAQNRLEEVKTKLEDKKYGEVFGMATATMNMVNNIYKKLKKIESQYQIEEQHKKENKSMQQYGKDILQKLIKTGVVSQKEAENIKEKLNNGQLDEIIEKYQDKFQKQTPPNSLDRAIKRNKSRMDDIEKEEQVDEDFNIEAYLKKTGLSQEKIDKVKENLKDLPDNIREKIKQVPIDMLLEISNTLKEGIQLPPQINKDTNQEKEQRKKVKVERETNKNQAKKLEREREREEKLEREREREKDKNFNQKSQNLPPRSLSSSKPTKSNCIQVITPAIKDGICKNFSTPCDVPKGWRKVNQCPSSVEDQTPIQKRDHVKKRELEKNKEQIDKNNEPKIEIDNAKKRDKQGNQGSIGSLFENVINFFK